MNVGEIIFIFLSSFVYTFDGLLNGLIYTLFFSVTVVQALFLLLVTPLFLTYQHIYSFNDI